MAKTNPAPTPRFDFLLSRSTTSSAYALWRLDIEGEHFLQPVPLDAKASFDPSHQVAQVGRYLLEWGPQMAKPYQPCYPYRLIEFDPTSADPLGLGAKTVQKGLWTKNKFWQYRADFANPNGAREGFESGDDLWLLPLGSFVLNVIPTAGRGTFQLWNFDPSPLLPGRADPLPAAYTPQGSFDTIQFGRELTPLGNYVLDRLPCTGEYRLWSFDPQSIMPLGEPALQQGRWAHITAEHQLVALGDHVLTWKPGRSGAHYELWKFDPKSADPLTGPVRRGTLPRGFDADTRLTGIHPPLPVDAARAAVPGTVDFMRSKIKHVVYFMVENRSFDHVCGWLHDKKDRQVKYLGHDAPFQGASEDMFNMAPGAQGGAPRKVMLSKFRGGKLDDSISSLDFLPNDPYHDKTDVMRQYFHGNPNGYYERAKPDMGGFVWNNGVDEVMMTYGPEQLPVLNGLGQHYAISDEWFSSMPGATDPNRAFAFTGSALGTLNNFQNGNQYIYWPLTAHRASIWKVLWANGITDWKIYNSVEWMSFVHTYHLFLQGQIPAVDANTTKYIAGIEQFKQDALQGKLPAFSMLEPAWIAPVGTTSYHPGADLVPGERALNDIYEALKNGPAWNETLLVITFDEHGGIFDHMPPPYAENPWPNDINDGFRYDMMGVRVPTIVVSPWVEEKTVFRSSTPVAYDSTSFMATLLQWFGVPRSRWCLGERTNHAPSFEGVLTRSTPRASTPTFTPPHDKTFPASGDQGDGVMLHDLHRLMAPRLIWALAGHKLGAAQTLKLTDDLMAQAMDLKSLHKLISDLAASLD